VLRPLWVKDQLQSHLFIKYFRNKEQIGHDLDSGHFIAEEQPQFVINQLSNLFGRNTTNSIR
jgi:hypothetical protein